MKIDFKKNKGFTLIELILYIGIAAVLLAVISLFLSTVIKSRLKQQSMTEVEAQGLQIMEQITHALRNAEEISNPSPGNSGDTLALSNSDGSQILTIFDLNGTQLQVTELSGGAIPLNNNRIGVSNLNFSNLSRSDTPGLIQTQFTLSHTNNSGRNEYTYAKTFQTSTSLRHP